MVILISSNKGGNTNLAIEYGGVSCLLVFCSSAYWKEKFGTTKLQWNLLKVGIL